MIRSIFSARFSAAAGGSIFRTCSAAAGIRHLSVAMRPDPLGAGGCKSAPSCSPRSTRGSSCSGSGCPPAVNHDLTRQDGGEVPRGDRARGEAAEHPDLDGLRRPGRPNFGIDNMVLFMRGPDDGQLRVAFTRDSGIKLAAFRERLRKVLPERISPGWRAAGARAGVQVRRRTASQAVDLRVPAGRHRDQRHELRLVRRRSRSGSSAPT